MNIENIKFIEAIVKEGSIRKAADKLFISQPAISSAIKKLEQELNIDIFDKNTYRATLTNEGKEFYERAKKVLDEFKKLEEYSQSLKSGIEIEIKIAIDAIYNIEKILPILNKTMESFPNTKLTFTVDYMEKVVDYLENQNFDLIICPKEFLEKTKLDLDMFFLETVNSYHVVSPLCYLAHMKKVTTEDLKEIPQVVIRSGSETSLGIVEESKKWYVNDFFLKKIIIMKGVAWGMVPEYYIKNELKEKKLIPLSNYENFKCIELQVFAIRKKNIRHGVVANSIWNNLKNICTKINP